MKLKIQALYIYSFLITILIIISLGSAHGKESDKSHKPSKEEKQPPHSKEISSPKQPEHMKPHSSEESHGESTHSSKTSTSSHGTQNDEHAKSSGSVATPLLAGLLFCLLLFLILLLT